MKENMGEKNLIKKIIVLFLAVITAFVFTVPAMAEGAGQEAADQTVTSEKTVLPAPAAGVASKGTTYFTAYWENVEGAAGWNLQYSSYKSMKAAKSITIGNKDIVRYKVSKLRSAAVYYFRIRAKDVNGTYGSWSQVKKVTTKSASKSELLSYVRKAPGGKTVRTCNTGYSLSKTGSGKALTKYVNFLRKKYKITFIMMDIKSGQIVTCNSKKVMYSASCLKGPYVASLNKWKTSGVRKHKSLQKNTIVYSNNETYAKLRSMYGSGPMKKMMKYSSVSSFDAKRKYAYLPCRDLGKLWIGTYWYFYKDKNSSSNYCRSLYTHGTQSFIYRGMKGKYKVHAKPGWYPGGGYNVQNDAGIVMAKVGGTSRPYMLCVMTSACGRHDKLRILVKKIDAVHTDMVK